MRFVLYVVRLPKNLMLLFVERVFVSANGLVCDVLAIRFASEVLCVCRERSNIFLLMVAQRIKS